MMGTNDGWQRTRPLRSLDHLLSRARARFRQNRNVWQTMSKDNVRVFAKQLFVFSVAVDYSGRWWVHHAIDIVYEFEDEASLSAL